MRMAMHHKLKYIFIATLLLLSNSAVGYQRFVNLTSDEVKIDSILPYYSVSIPMEENFRDSIYQVSILYPEFIDMSANDIRNYQRISGNPLEDMPAIRRQFVTARKQNFLHIGFVPLVKRDGKYRMLVSFMLKVESSPRENARKIGRRAHQSAADRYAEHSVLAKGNWVKIRIPQSGVYELTPKIVADAGFSDFSKVKIFGYGGKLQNEKLLESDLIRYDDLKELPTCNVNGHRLFYGQGTVTWTDKDALKRTRNPYSDYGYYFLTQSDTEPQYVNAGQFLASFYPSPDDYHSLYEKDGYAWFQGGRNLFDPIAIPNGHFQTYEFENLSKSEVAKLMVNVSAGVPTQVQVVLNGEPLGVITVTQIEYDKGSEKSKTFNVSNLSEKNTVKLTTISGGPARLDFISFAWKNPKPAPDLSQTKFPVPEVVGRTGNQDLHNDPFADMVMIIPASKKLLGQALRLKKFHEEHDKFRVNIVAADALYNEFSSGTPDVNAYRRYLKMLYDRAQTKQDEPKYLLLFGDCLWDNRMLTSDAKSLNSDDYLLCYEGENSFNEEYSFVNDGFFGLLDDGEGDKPTSKDLLDLAIGRFPVTTEKDAKTMVDKTIRYVKNDDPGIWQNTIMFMGDDGNFNLHMRYADEAAERLMKKYPGYIVKKVMWDAYQRQTSSTGNTYPEATRVIKQQQEAGALIMDYSGHGSENQISHEAVLKINDFSNFSNHNLSLWVAATCDVMPFDGSVPNIGEVAVLNEKGGAFAFFGTTRAVRTNYNRVLNLAYLNYVLGKKPDGKPYTIGEAQMLAKNEMILNGRDTTVNKLHNSLLGDPAIVLNRPIGRIEIDSINGADINAGFAVNLRAGSIATVQGHMVDAPDFNGIVAVTVRDHSKLITCRLNERGKDAPDEPFQFEERPTIIFNGSDSVRNGKFTIRFSVSRDIDYSDESGLMNFYAFSSDYQHGFSGYTNRFTVGGSSLSGNDSIGPSIYCYLNSPSFTNGDDVNTTPYFVADITDEDGINATGNGIGHDLELIIDGDMSKTYNLNDNFTYDFGSFTKGSTHFSIPSLMPGKHKLLFRAWDIFNNPSSTELSFNVVSGLDPTLVDINCTKNPATDFTSFLISHDRQSCDLDIEIELFDMSGRLLWRHKEKSFGSGSVCSVNWDLTVDDGHRLQTGVYLYRVSIASNGSRQVSKAKKLVVIGNK